jgi:hypothetical protein
MAIALASRIPEGPQMPDKVSRDHVDAVLQRVGASTDERNALLDELDFPADLDTLIHALEAKGVSRDMLVSLMGGSP